jgi:hypothetical protein
MKVRVPVSAPWALDAEGKRITSVTIKVVGKAEEDSADMLCAPPKQGATDAQRQSWLKDHAETMIKLALVAYNQDEAGKGGVALAVKPGEAHPFDKWSQAARSSVIDTYSRVNTASEESAKADFSQAQPVD